MGRLRAVKRPALRVKALPKGSFARFEACARSVKIGLTAARAAARSG